MVPMSGAGIHNIQPRMSIPLDLNLESGTMMCSLSSHRSFASPCYLYPIILLLSLSLLGFLHRNQKLSCARQSVLPAFWGLRKSRRLLSFILAIVFAL